MRPTRLILLAAALMTACTYNSPVDYVDPLIGSGGHGHVFVGANVPYGMVQLGPTSIPQEWDWTSGYQQSDSTCIGFSHTHLSGTGIGDLFDITLMPVVGKVSYARGSSDDPESGLWSMADRTREIARPGYYAVPLKRYKVLAELTASCRVGVSRYTFPAADDAAIVIDLENGGCWDKTTETFMQQTSPTKVEGYRFSSGWAKAQKVYFAAEFSRPMESFTLCGEDNRYGRAAFSTNKGEQILVKVALSPASVEGARMNLAAEVPDFDFERVRRSAERLWSNALDKVRIETDDESSRRIFYTALYHTMVAPSVFSDVDAHVAAYTTLSLWDTYRAAQPLMTILNPEMTDKVVGTMLNICDSQGRLPVWHLWDNETDCMVGNPGICVVADAITKNIGGFDRERAFDAIRRTAMDAGRGGDLRQLYGYIPSELMNESVAYDMEYAIADGAAALAAKALGKADDYKFFLNRSHSYRNYFDPSTGFMRGRCTDGSFATPFNPFHATHRANDYCEGNAWQYTWLAPHDVDGLIECFGSRDKFVAKLDSLFLAEGDMGTAASPDISGLIGQYAHGNEPSHHIVYLYTMIGEPWKTSDRVREVLTLLYRDNADGLSGNEDVGQMSAWYILSSMGFYQAEPAGGRFYFGSPLFDKVAIDVPGGTFRIEARNNSAENRYIQSITLNGRPYAKPYIEYADIMRAGRLVFEMGSNKICWYD